MNLYWDLFAGNPPALHQPAPARSKELHLVRESASAFHFAGYATVDDAYEEFLDLASRWHADTAHLSSVEAIALHPSYQRIIGMGDQAVPMILTDLRTRGGHWYWALRAITNESPVPTGTQVNIRQLKKAWLDWGKERYPIQVE